MESPGALLFIGGLLWTSLGGGGWLLFRTPWFGIAGSPGAVLMVLGAFLYTA